MRMNRQPNSISAFSRWRSSKITSSAGLNSKYLYFPSNSRISFRSSQAKSARNRPRGVGIGSCSSGCGMLSPFSRRRVLVSPADSDQESKDSRTRCALLEPRFTGSESSMAIRLSTVSPFRSAWSPMIPALGSSRTRAQSSTVLASDVKRIGLPPWSSAEPRRRHRGEDDAVRGRVRGWTDW
jgi:hypothetical protein